MSIILKSEIMYHLIQDAFGELNIMKTIFVTDLDGTLLDKTYDYKPVEKFIRKLKAKKVDVVFSSSKTLEEQEYYREKLHIKDPFIVEIGSAIFIPRDFFSHIYPRTRSVREYHVIEYGLRIEVIEKLLKDVENVYNVSLKRFTKMAPHEISEVTGLPLKMAEWARKRMYSEVIVKGFPNEDEIKEILRRYFHLNVFTSERLITVVGRADKGVALRILENLYYEEYESIEIIAAGDGEADIPMILAADLGIYVSNGKRIPNVLKSKKNVVIVNNREELIEFMLRYLSSSRK